MENLLARVLFILFVASSIANADEVRDWGAETLTGDWNGLRTSLYDSGVTVEITHKSDLLSNSKGGIRQGSVWLANTEAAINMDMGKLADWEGATVFIQYHSQHGRQARDFNGSYVGSFAGVDNIETGINNSQFFQAWLQQNMAEDRFSVLAGLYAIDSEFYVTETSGLFLQPPYGMSAEMAQTGQNGPPVFPVGALGVRMKYAPPSFYFQGAVTDGVPGDPNNPRGTQIRLDKWDGTLSIFELGYMPSRKEDEPISKTAIGLWSYSTPAFDLVDPAIRPRDRGAYFLSEHMLRAERDHPGQGLSGFVRFGKVNKDAYQADRSGSLGLHYKGLFDGRDDDEAGIAVTQSRASDKYRQLNASDPSETVVEVTYREQFLPWVAVQLSLQRIINPNMDPTLKDASVIGVRLELNL